MTSIIDENTKILDYMNSSEGKDNKNLRECVDDIVANLKPFAEKLDLPVCSNSK